MSIVERMEEVQIWSASILPRRARRDSSPAGSFPWTAPWSHMRSLTEDVPLGGAEDCGDAERNTKGRGRPSSDISAES